MWRLCSLSPWRLGGAAWADAPPPEFAPKVDYPSGALSWAVAMGDFNGDGKPDLAVAAYGDNSVSVLLGVGDGTFGIRDIIARPADVQ